MASDELIERDLPELLEFLAAAIPYLAVRPLLGSVLTGTIMLGVRSVAEYRERVRTHPIVPFAMGHRPTRRELARYIRREPEFAGLLADLEAAELASGAEAWRRWDSLATQLAAAQGELAAPLAGDRGAVARLDGFLKHLLHSATVGLPSKDKRALLREAREQLEKWRRQRIADAAVPIHLAS